MLLQVGLEQDDPTVRDRELRALAEAASEHPRATLHLVTLAPESVTQVPPRVEVHPAAPWLTGLRKV